MLIDSDQNGLIDLDEFVTGCQQLHGPAKSIQIARMSHETKVGMDRDSWKMANTID